MTFTETERSQRPPQADIDRAIRVEQSLQPHEIARYMEFLNQTPMSQRTTDQQLRDGCILVGLFERTDRAGKHMT